MTFIVLMTYVYRTFYKFRHFKILKATMRRVILHEDGHTTTYTIQVETKKSSDELIFEEVWIDEKKFKVRLSDTKRSLISNFSEKQVLNLHLSSDTGPEEIRGSKTTTSRGKAKLGYSIGNKRKFMTIRTFEETGDHP